MDLFTDRTTRWSRRTSGTRRANKTTSLICQVHWNDSICLRRRRKRKPTQSTVGIGHQIPTLIVTRWGSRQAALEQWSCQEPSHLLSRRYLAVHRIVESPEGPVGPASVGPVGPVGPPKEDQWNR